MNNSIVRSATLLDEISNDINELEIDLFTDKDELNRKENDKRRIQNELLFYDDFEELYKSSDEYELDEKLLYPFKEIYDREGNKVFVRKSSEEYKEDIHAYLEELMEAYKEGKIDASMFKMLKEETIELANRQLDRIEEEEKEQEEEIDLHDEYESILDSIENTKQAFIANEIGE